MPYWVEATCSILKMVFECYLSKKAISEVKCCVEIISLPLFSHHSSAKFHWQRNGFINPSRSKHFKRVRMHILMSTFWAYTLTRSLCDLAWRHGEGKKKDETGSVKLTTQNWKLLKRRRVKVTSPKKRETAAAIRRPLNLKVALANFFYFQI